MLKEMNPEKMNDIFVKMNELKDLFKVGEKLVPIIQGLIEFMKDILPLIEKINNSINDSANKMPQASNQINSVTSATELATTEILDIVDKITNDLYEVEKKMAEYTSKIEARDAVLRKIDDALSGMPEHRGLVQELKDTFDVSDVLQFSSSRIEQFKQDTYQITLSLQVQDITAQQLAAVNHLIESVHQKLSTLIEDIDGSDIRDNISSLNISIPENVHYDPNATYLKDKDHQQKIDDIIKDHQQTATQEEIDKLFS